MGCVRSFLAVLGTNPLRRFCCLAAETLEGADGQPVPLWGGSCEITPYTWLILTDYGKKGERT